MLELFVAIIVAMGVWFAYDTLRARESATRVATAACKENDLQFLDATVFGTRIRFARDGQGLMRLRRTFLFEFSENGVTRRAGSVVMLGSNAESVQFEPYRIS